MRTSNYIYRYLLPGLVCVSLGFAEAEPKVVALTFDDGPNPPYTERLLQVLETNGVHASFFLIGDQIMEHPATARRILAAGHEVGGHSSDWESLAFKRRKTVEAKLDKMDAAFAEIGVTNLIWFRPPGGILMPWQKPILRDRGLIHISADVVVGDWKEIDAERIAGRVLKKVRPGSIVVLHDGGGDRSATIKAVPLIIRRLKKEGWTFVTVGGLARTRE